MRLTKTISKQSCGWQDLPHDCERCVVFIHNKMLNHLFIFWKIDNGRGIVHEQIFLLLGLTYTKQVTFTLTLPGNSMIKF